MHRITLILILCLLLPDMYIYLVYIARKTRNIIWRTAYWLPTIVLAGIYMYYIYMTGDNALSHHAQGIGRLAVATMLFAAPKSAFMLCSLLGIMMRGVCRFLSFIIFRTPFRKPRSPFVVHRLPYTLLGLIVGTLCFANILYGAVAGITHFEVKNVEYRSENIPKGFDGYRILQLSDIHIGSWQGKPEAVRQLVNLVNEQEADLIIFTGDLVNQQSHELDGFKETLSRLHAPAGVYSVLGNHDYGTYYRWRSKKEEVANLQYLIEQQKNMGWKTLNNEHAILYHKGDSIALIGVENDGEPPFSQFADLPKAIQGTESMFRVLLSHNPTHWRREVLPESEIELTLSGHTHAMQMELFGRSLASLIYPEWTGMYYEGNRALYVNVGIGYVGLPFRFGAWPEITVIKLVSGKG
ncbi:metallophosphoesterase [uncultured Bacteroides sp.]|uniref:metallophosphoesterase n=1 Tax=uncultured Bacteroides sp. TaxID=162156 RepID=UPI0025E3E4CE|nr:metallophosphoesterase [uncultured Bacteroides sp.]